MSNEKVTLRLHPLADRLFVRFEELSDYDRQFVADAVSDCPVVTACDRAASGLHLTCKPGTVDDAAADLRRLLTRDGFAVEVEA